MRNARHFNAGKKANLITVPKGQYAVTSRGISGRIRFGASLEGGEIPAQKWSSDGVPPECECSE